MGWISAMADGRSPVIRPLPGQIRQPPMSLESEQSVLGGIMLDNRAWHIASERVSEADFYRADHRLIWSALSELAGAGKPCDFVTLSEALRARRRLDEAGGLSYLGGLANDTPSAANVASYADIVRERSVLRSLIAAGGDIAELGYRPDGRETAELIAEAQGKIMALRTAGERGEPVEIGSLGSAWHENLTRRLDGKEQGLMGGLRDLDAAIGGFEPGDDIVIAGRPGSGKTSAALTLIGHISRTYGPTLGFSMEMPKEQWYSRLIAAHGVPVWKLRQPKKLADYEHDRIIQAIQTTHNLPFYVDDQGGLTFTQLRAKALRLQAKLKARGERLRAVMLDYVQLMHEPGKKSDNRTNELSAISRGIKALAKELECPFFVLSQLNRGVEARDNKRPRVSDLKECGSLEEDADIVLLMYRDEEYDQNSPHKGVCEIEIAKQRNGARAHIEVGYRGELCLFEDWNGPSFNERRPIPTQEHPKAKRKQEGIRAYLNGDR